LSASPLEVTLDRKQFRQPRWAIECYQEIDVAVRSGFVAGDGPEQGQGRNAKFLQVLLVGADDREHSFVLPDSIPHANANRYQAF